MKGSKAWFVLPWGTNDKWLSLRNSWPFIPKNTCWAQQIHSKTERFAARCIHVLVLFMYCIDLLSRILTVHKKWPKIPYILCEKEREHTQPPKTQILSPNRARNHNTCKWCPTGFHSYIIFRPVYSLCFIFACVYGWLCTVYASIGHACVCIGFMLLSMLSWFVFVFSPFLSYAVLNPTYSPPMNNWRKFNWSSNDIYSDFILLISETTIIALWSKFNHRFFFFV